VQAHGGRLTDLSIYGQESNPTTWRLAKMNLAIRGIEANLGRKPAQLDATWRAALAANEPVLLELRAGHDCP
jgi:type I restriction-modification system DNA methylase subunit